MDKRGLYITLGVAVLLFIVVSICFVHLVYKSKENADKINVYEKERTILYHKQDSLINSLVKLDVKEKEVEKEKIKSQQQYDSLKIVLTTTHNANTQKNIPIKYYTAQQLDSFWTNFGN